MGKEFENWFKSLPAPKTNGKGFKSIGKFGLYVKKSNDPEGYGAEYDAIKVAFEAGLARSSPVLKNGVSARQKKKKVAVLRLKPNLLPWGRRKAR